MSPLVDNKDFFRETKPQFNKYCGAIIDQQKELGLCFNAHIEFYALLSTCNCCFSSVKFIVLASISSFRLEI
jgi:hypothetical protein